MISREALGSQEGGGGQEAGLKKIQDYIFNFKDLLGQGNFSKVYKGWHELTNQPVAIKIVELNSLKSKKLEELLFSQIDILKKINHPNILKCHEVFTSKNNCYIVTELCSEGDLEAKLKTLKLMREDEAAPFIRGVFQGLLYLADLGIVHRDIKVSNVFVHKGEAKIADFGFAKATRTKFKDINIGSPIYMSPEGLIENVYGPKTDIWAFGILMFELLHGKTPFSHCKSEQELKYNLSIPIGWTQLKADLSPDLKEAILKCLQISETARPSAQQLSTLAYFRDLAPNSPSKQHHQQHKPGRSFMSFDFSNTHHSLSNDSFKPVFKSDSNQMFEGKYRIKTEHDSYLKKIDRQLSSGPTHNNTSGPYHNTSGFTHNTAGFTHSNNKSIEDRLPFRGRETAGFLRSPTSPTDKKSGKNASSFTALSSQDRQLTLTRPEEGKKQEAIISGQLNFKECVNILHYCRLLFKHLILMRDMAFGDQNQRSIFKRWLSTVLKSLKREVEEGRVACGGENAAARERKLREVTGEYVKKYSYELELDLSRVRLEESAVINYEKICNYFGSVQQLVDQLVEKDPRNPSLLQLGHSMVLVVHSSRVLRKCYEERSYLGVEGLREVEEYLGMKREELDHASYVWYKSKYL